MRYKKLFALLAGVLATVGGVCARCRPEGDRRSCDLAAELSPDTRALLAGWAVTSDAVVPDGLPRRIRRIKDGGEMALIPKGEFEMGGIADDPDAESDERPRRKVTLTEDYYLDINEVTNEQFESFVVATGYRSTAERLSNVLLALRPDGVAWSSRSGATWKTPRPEAGRAPEWRRLPAVFVSFDDALAFAEWAGASLPSEAEFERALRGGKDGMRFPWGDSSAPPLNYGNYLGIEFKRSFPLSNFNVAGWTGDDFPTLAPVRSFRPNQYGIFDLSGNVWEWCADWYQRDAYERTNAVDPTGPPTGTERVVRGGAWSTGLLSARSSCRARQVPSEPSDFTGFRLARRVGLSTAAGTVQR